MVDVAAFLDKNLGKNAEQIGISGFLDTGLPELNEAIGGGRDKGVPIGRVLEIFGPASCGKTFLATQIMAAAQRAGGIAGFSDHERSFEPNLAESIGLDLDPNKFRFVMPQTFEESIDIAVQFCEMVRQNDLIDPDAPLVWVFDSVASMIPHSKLFDKEGKRRGSDSYNMNDSTALSRSTSQSYPMLVQFAQDNNMTVLLLNQIRTKPGVMFGDPTTTPGGQAAEFYASVRLQIGKKEIAKGQGKDKEILGFQINAKTVKNKVTRPFRSASWQVRFEEGGGVMVDDAASNLDYAIRSGLVPKEGTRVEWDGKKLFQTQVADLLRSNPDEYKKLLDLLSA